MTRAFTVAALLLLLSSGPLAHADELLGRVVKITDGDTLVVLLAKKQIKVRLTDIDAPERKQAFGTRSRQSLAELCAGKDARVAEQGKDRYGRTLGRVYCAGVDANAEAGAPRHGVGLRQVRAEGLAAVCGTGRGEGGAAWAMG